MTDKQTPKAISPDFEQWPQIWSRTPADVGYGRELLAEMEPFILHLIEQEVTETQPARCSGR